VTLWITIAVIAALLIAAIITWLLHATGRTSDKLHDELVKRVVSWAVMTPLLLGPVLLGAAWTILAVSILSILCYREFARATGFFRHRSLSIVVVLGIIATTFDGKTGKYTLTIDPASRRVETDAAVNEANTDRDCDERYPKSGSQLEHRAGEERDPKRLHSRLPVLLAPASTTHIAQ
jgi:amino acid transporter